MEAVTNEKVEKKKRNPVFIIVLGLLLIAGGWFGITKYQHGLHHEETDDANITGDMSPVIPRVSGYVAEVKVHDNQWVDKGDTLLVLDDRDYLIRLEQAEAALHNSQSTLSSAKAATDAARANISTTQAAIGTIDAQIEAAKVTLWRATQDYQRYANLVKDHSITQQQYEQALAAKESAEKQVAILEEQKKQASQQTNAVAAQSNATSKQIDIAGTSIEQRRADVDAAKLNLSYTVITAQRAGLISRVNVQPGQFVQPGQSLFNIVHSESKWVVANFKETQINKMRVGQVVIVKADAFPKHKFQARVSSFSPATGSTFSLLPADNASGNFVKVVQRLPVKIDFTDTKDTLVKRLRLGMSVRVDVHLD